ncbi:MAG: pseudouridine synthase [Deltaproteobacteria bacterium]|nr:pseudouridine synthase [Deltaproteobacteria bacterium]
MERIQKMIAATGLCSRRHAEELIQKGEVMVNGQPATIGMKVSPQDTIVVQGKPLSGRPASEFLVLHKPKNVMVTRHDPQKRPTVYEYLPKGSSLLSVGRLDFDSEGLLLFTSRREIIHQLTHPSFEIPRTYEVKVQGVVTPETMAKITSGVSLGVGALLQKSGPATVRLLKTNPYNCWVEITLKEGKNREVRKIFEAVGHLVLRLKRVAYGPVRLGDLPPGASRPLEPEEERQLDRLLKSLVG